MTKDGGPLVSVLIPVYNVEPFIEEALLSILEQTYQNIEVIIVDDNSSDSTFRLCGRIASGDGRIKLFKNSKNIKISKTLNFGLKHCSGDYILRMDGDDIASIDRIEVLLSELEGRSLDLVSSHVIFIDQAGVELSRATYPFGPDRMVSYVKNVAVCSHNWLVKKSVYETLDGYRDIPSVEDFDFLQRAVKAGFLVGNANYWGMKVRVRHGNTVDEYGLHQRLAFRFVKNLNQKDGVCFDKEEFCDYVGRYLWWHRAHRLSDRLLKRYILDKSLIRYFWLFGSLLVSPFQAEKFVNRLIYKVKFFGGEVKNNRGLAQPFLKHSGMGGSK